MNETLYIVKMKLRECLKIFKYSTNAIKRFQLCFYHRERYTKDTVKRILQGDRENLSNVSHEILNTWNTIVEIVHCRGIDRLDARERNTDNIGSTLVHSI